MLVQSLQEAEAEIELDSHETYWGAGGMPVKDKGRGDKDRWGEASYDDTGRPPGKGRGKEGGLGRKSLKP